jgi:hypothetical protein
MEQAYTVELSQPEMILPTLLSIWQPFITGVGRFTHKSCVRIAQTHDAVTHRLRKTAVNDRVKRNLGGRNLEVKGPTAAQNLAEVT